MNILYRGPIFDASGYGHAARNYIKDLVYSGFNVNFKVESYDKDKTEFNIEPTSFEQTPDIYIQHVNPGLISNPIKGALNIGITTHETNKISKEWAKNLNQLDLIIVPCFDNKLAFETSSVTKPIHVVSHCFDTTIYDNEYETIELKGFDENKLNFYSIFNMSYKKGLDILVPAFCFAFQDCPDEVSLTLRISFPGGYTPEGHNGLANNIRTLKNATGLEKTPDILYLPHHLTEEEMYGLHQKCDVFVIASRGEGWCIPAFDAMAFGKTPIAASWGGMDTYLNIHTGYPVDYFMTPPMFMNNPKSYPPFSEWGQPRMKSLIRQFRKVKDIYNTDLHSLKVTGGISASKKYDFREGQLSKTINQILNERQQQRIERERKFGRVQEKFESKRRSSEQDQKDAYADALHKTSDTSNSSDKEFPGFSEEVL